MATDRGGKSVLPVFESFHGRASGVAFRRSCLHYDPLSPSPDADSSLTSCSNSACRDKAPSAAKICSNPHENKCRQLLSVGARMYDSKPVISPHLVGKLLVRHWFLHQIILGVINDGCHPFRSLTTRGHGSRFQCCAIPQHNIALRGTTTSQRTCEHRLILRFTGAVPGMSPSCAITNLQSLTAFCAGFKNVALQCLICKQT